jgi:hypothetical protein
VTTPITTPTTTPAPAPKAPNKVLTLLKYLLLIGGPLAGLWIHNKTTLNEVQTGIGVAEGGIDVIADQPTN